MSQLELVIFDCDGVLVDSEPVTNRIMAEMVTELGLPMTREDCYEAFMGRSMTSCMQIISERLGRPVPPGFAENYHSRAFAALERELQPVPGVAGAIRKIRVPVCVASSSEPEMIRTSLALTGLLPLFEGRLFSATQVARGKPHPDVFLHAARAMGAAPGSCVVVEDTPVGVQAGVAAGMTVLGYAGLMNSDRLADAGARVFSDMGELPTLLAD